MCMLYLKPLVLQDLLDGHQLPGVAEFSLVDDTKRAVADDLGVGVADFLWPVGALAWSGHNCRYLAAIFIPYRQRHSEHTSVQNQVDTVCTNVALNGMQFSDPFIIFSPHYFVLKINKTSKNEELVLSKSLKAKEIENQTV